MHRKGEFTKIKGSTCNIPIEASHQNYGRSSVMIDKISNLVKQSFPEIRRNDPSLNETIWTPECDKLHVFDMVEKMKRKRLVY